VGGIGAAATLWFVAAESIEGAHADGALPIIAVALVVATWLVRLAASALLHFIGEIVLAIARTVFADRTPQWILLAHPVVRATSEPSRFRRFARPPPGAMHRLCI
jgi:hypothetical protein